MVVAIDVMLTNNKPTPLAPGSEPMIVQNDTVKTITSNPSKALERIEGENTIISEYGITVTIPNSFHYYDGDEAGIQAIRILPSGQYKQDCPTVGDCPPHDLIALFRFKDTNRYTISVDYKGFPSVPKETMFQIINSITFEK